MSLFFYVISFAEYIKYYCWESYCLYRHAIIIIQRIIEKFILLFIIFNLLIFNFRLNISIRS